MITTVADLVLSGVFLKKQDFVMRICSIQYRHLIPYISFYDNLVNNKDFWMSLDDNEFLLNKLDILVMVKNKHFRYNNDYVYLDEEFNVIENPSTHDAKKYLYISSIGAYKCMTDLTRECIENLNYINSEYKYYLDDLLYLNINIKSV